MAVFTAQDVKANVRVRDGKRVFYLAEGDVLTPSARDWLQSDNVEILSAAQAKPKFYRTEEGRRITEKPEHMTHLKPDVLVPKEHPRIVFRGLLDALQAEILLCGSQVQGQLRRDMAELLAATRQIMRCDVLEEPWTEKPICGLTPEELRAHSHFPQKYYDQPHFMPDFDDSPILLQLNRLRTMVRQTELAACRAFSQRKDLIQVLNRLSSLVWILMIRLKKESGHEANT